MAPLLAQPGLLEDSLVIFGAVMAVLWLPVGLVWLSRAGKRGSWD